MEVRLLPGILKMSKHKHLPRKEFLKTLSGKRISAGALFFNERGELLMVKPNYTNYWSLPGGIVDKNESPLAGCIREIEEEIGLKIRKLSLIACTYVFDKKYNDESIQLHFYGGKLTEKQIGSIVLDNEELDEYQFVPLKDVIDYNKQIGEKIENYKLSINNNTISYFEEYK